jgi:hypothetical protein
MFFSSYLLTSLLRCVAVVFSVFCPIFFFFALASFTKFAPFEGVKAVALGMAGLYGWAAAVPAPVEACEMNYGLSSK